MRCLVTGGAGFIGSHLAELLLEQGHEVVIIDNLVSGRLRNLQQVSQIEGFKFVEKDIRDADSIQSDFEGVDWVFHLAGLADIVPSIEVPDEYFATNVTGTFNVLECAKKNNIQKVVYAASSSSYGLAEIFPTPETAKISPEYPYALSKHMGEELVLHWEKLYGLPAISLRLFNVYGPRSRTSGAYGAVFGVFLAQKLNARPFTVVGDGTQTRDFTHVSDVARAFLAAAKSSVTGEAMNVGSGSHYSVNRLVNLLGGDVEYIAKRPGEPDCTFASVKKIKSMLDWEATVSFEDGVKQMLDVIDDWADAPIWTKSSIAEVTEAWFKFMGKKNG